jgi:hypothetical protein
MTLQIKVIRDGKDIYTLTWSERDNTWTPSPYIVPTIATAQLGYVIARAIEFNPVSEED